MNTSIDDIELIRKMYSTKTVLTEESEMESSQTSRGGGSRYHKANRINIEKISRRPRGEGAENMHNSIKPPKQIMDN